MALAPLAIAIFLFAAWHVALGIGTGKARAKQALGKAFGPLYGLVSSLLLIFVLWAFRQADVTTLYEPPNWGRHANYALSLIGFIFIGIFLFRGSWRNQLRYPMALGISFWVAGHLLANGDNRTTLLFVGLLLAAWLQVLLGARSTASASVERQGHNGLSLLAGVALFGLATQLHTVLAGVPLFILQK